MGLQEKGKSGRHQKGRMRRCGILGHGNRERGKRGLDDGNDSDRMERGQKDGDGGMETEPGQRDVD